ncbi:MAG: UvrD-helicase domain-containing protein, partial [Geobacter sp.]
MKQLDRMFDRIRERLNAEQRTAVETIEGPVLVIAGPGTGKTEILAARIATILRVSDALPENILCLTYTDAGTVAMRSRLLEFIGPDAYRVDIFTFHAFCNLVIQENADQFGIRSLAPVSELEQFQLVREIIDGFPQDHPLTRSTGDIHFESDRLLALYEIMKKEDWSADFLAQQADRHAASLADDPEYRYKRATKDR